MRHITIAFALIFSFLFNIPSFATNPSTGPAVHILAGTTNIGTSFTTSYPQLAITAPRDGYKHVYVYNGCSGTIALTFTSGQNNTGVAPSSTTIFQYYVGPTSTGNGLVLDIGGGRNVWVRSDSGSACSSGDVDIALF
jgi:hypothetical protein